MRKLSSDALKPHLRNSSLYARNLPKDVTDQEISHIFRGFQVMRVRIFGVEEVCGGWRPQLQGEVRGTKSAQVEFSTIAFGELLRIFYITHYHINNFLSTNSRESPRSFESLCYSRIRTTYSS